MERSFAWEIKLPGSVKDSQEQSQSIGRIWAGCEGIYESETPAAADWVIEG